MIIMLMRAAGAACDQAKRAADQESDQHRRYAHEECALAAVKQTAQHVAAEFVGAEQMSGRTDRLETRKDAGMVRISWRNQRRAHHADHEQEQDEAAADGARIAPQIAPHGRPIAA